MALVGDKGESNLIPRLCMALGLEVESGVGTLTLLCLTLTHKF
jgi:hypothetical protein